MIGWFAVYTRPRAEATAQEHLRRQGYEVYLPRFQKYRRHARRVDVVNRPLFPRYLFVAFDKMQRWRPILSTVGVCDIVRQGNAPSMLPTSLIVEIQSREQNGWFDQISPLARFKPGDAVRVAIGPFSDMVGRFCGMADAERVYVLLELLGRQVKTRLPGEAIIAA